MLISTISYDKFTGLPFFDLTISSLFQATASLWNNAITKKLYNDFAVVSAYLEDNYSSLTTDQKLTAD